MYVLLCMLCSFRQNKFTATPKTSAYITTNWSSETLSMALSFQSAKPFLWHHKVHLRNDTRKSWGEPPRSLCLRWTSFSPTSSSLCTPVTLKSSQQRALKKPAISPPWPGRGLANPAGESGKRTKRAGGGVAPFPQGLCMCKYLSLWPELWGINKLLRKQRTDLQPLFHEFRRNQFTAENCGGGRLILPITAFWFNSKSLLCHSQNLLLWDVRHFRMPKSR